MLCRSALTRLNRCFWQTENRCTGARLICSCCSIWFPAFSRRIWNPTSTENKKALILELAKAEVVLASLESQKQVDAQTAALNQATAAASETLCGTAPQTACLCAGLYPDQPVSSSGRRPGPASAAVYRGTSTLQCTGCQSGRCPGSAA